MTGRLRRYQRHQRFERAVELAVRAGELLGIVVLEVLAVAAMFGLAFGALWFLEVVS